MTVRGMFQRAIATALIVTVAGCGGGSGSGDSGLLRKTGISSDENIQRQRENTPIVQGQKRSTIWDLFSNADDPNTTVEVNKYLWNASLDVLSFLPVQSVDPFSGVIVTGYGTPPGGGRAYRATIYVQDPALDARSLKVALASRSGPVSGATQRAVEDAILTRARQLRIQDSNL